MISVGLVTGDLNMTADGTVTYIDGTASTRLAIDSSTSGSAEIRSRTLKSSPPSQPEQFIQVVGAPRMARHHP